MRKILMSILLILITVVIVACKKKPKIEFSFKHLEASIEVDETYTIEYDITEGNEVEFSLSAANIISIDGNDITGISVGEVIITGTVKEHDITDTMKIIVRTKTVIPEEKVDVESVTITGPRNGFQGETLRLNIEVLPENATNKEVVWESSDELIATVNEVGVLTLLKEGSVTITATADNVSETYRVTINPETIENNFFYELEFNGGNVFYETREDMVNDWLADFNKFNVSRYTVDNLPMGAWNVTNMHLFFYDEEYRDKWLWVAEYLSEVGSSTNRGAAAAIVSSPTVDAFNSVNSNYRYAISYEVRGFMVGVKFTDNANWQSADYSLSDLKNGFWAHLISSRQASGFFSNEGKIALPTNIYLENYEFKGWYDNPDFYGLVFTEIGRTMKLYARFDEIDPVTDLTITNDIEEILKGNEHQLDVLITPSDAFNKLLIYSTSDDKVLTVTADGLIKAVNAGEAEITVTNYNGKVVVKMDVVVYPKDDLTLTFNKDFNGFININDEFSLEVSGVGKINSEKEYSFKVKDSSILSLSGGNNFKALKAGITEIEIYDESEKIYTYQVIVQQTLSSSNRVDQLLELLASGNNAVVNGLNVITYYTASQEWSDPRMESVNTYLFDKFVVDSTTYPADPTKFSNRLMTSTEFILVHDTANLTGGLASHGAFFANPANQIGIHYTTGDYGIVSSLPDEYVGWHAGDGTGSTFAWLATGIDAPNNDKPVIDLSTDGYFTINGIKTSILAPKGRNGEILDNSYFTYQGPTWDIQDGKYVLGTHWFATGQQARGVIATRGGNLNSIGIEMNINRNGDIIDTVQRTAKLVANLLEEHNLGYHKVIMHNTTDGKGDPYTLNNTIYNGTWYFDRFMEHVVIEREVLANFGDATITLSSDSDLISRTGRVVRMPSLTTEVEYTITVEIDGVSKSITLVSVIPGTSTWNQNYGFFRPTQAWAKSDYRVEK